MTVPGKFYNRAWAQVQAAPGLGNVALGGAAFPNFLSFSDAGVLDQDPLTILFQDGNNVELSECVYTAAGTSLARNVVRFSINGGVKGTTKLTLSGATICSVVEGAEDQVSVATGSFIAIPAMDGVGAAGSSILYSRGDHTHPSDTSRAPLASPAFTGTPTAPTPATADSSTTVATTAFVHAVAASGGGGGGAVAFNNYTSSQTITIPTGATKAMVELWGGTGSGGGFTASNVVSGGTGAGGYLRKFLTGLVAGNTLVLTVGAGGAGVVSGIAGNPGGASTLVSGTQTIATLTANGSLGSGVNTSAGSAGGTATGGDFNMTGQSGHVSYVNPTDNSYMTGMGGHTMYSIGATGSSGYPTNAGNAGGCLIAWYA